MKTKEHTARRKQIGDIVKTNLAWIITTLFLAGAMFTTVRDNKAELEKCSAKVDSHGREISSIAGKLDGIDKNVQLILKKLTR